ncbi:hypothetical protein BDY19DRAFT_1040877 [Irpex rosettiformis]|uniref:Uncharacterized protein n=1 Tax=Irpex rosettiformis TaxID=378272 RepID=A0ACB8U906_9APHY|nr:hypothetical protein BDY19DRAFT_1040877 [Irpex rosettiformis]
MSKRIWIVLVVCLMLGLACAQNSSSDGNSTLQDGFPFDPILQFRPSFARSLPIQILVTGVVLTLTSVLLIHLVFTAQYHWPLAPINYALQLSAVITLLISLIATIRVVLQAATDESLHWPYMLTYISVDIPPLRENTDAEWATGTLAAWLLMNATTSALIQITHIQFLTLLFPSRLERRLIFILLGPLAIVAAIMQLVPLNDSHEGGKLTSIADAIQNVCNATLSLLFTASLFIWGFLVNRKQAWRTDGGTAAFGVGALILAIASTTITFVYIPSKDQYDWMPGFMWAVILWQSFLGWWWWVGAGMGVGEVDELLRREEKRRRKRRAKEEARQHRKEKAQTFWRGVTGSFGGSGKSRQNSVRSGGPERGRLSMSRENSITRNSINSAAPPRPTSPTSSSLTSDASSTITTGVLGQIRSLARSGYGWYQYLRHAHLTAAREQAEENSEKIQQVYGREGVEVSENPSEVGWGLGHFGVRQVKEANDADREDGFRGILEESRSDLGEWVDEHEHEEPGTTETAHGQATDQGIARRRGWRFRRGDASIDMTSVSRSRPTLRPPASDERPSSMWYWGPLRRWRLQDSTVYS